MKFLTAVFFLIAVFSITNPAHVTAQIIECNSEARQGQVLTVVSDEPGQWSVDAGQLDAHTGTTVKWKVPSTVHINPSQYKIRMISYVDGSIFEKTVKVYTDIEITGDMDPAFIPYVFFSLTASGGRSQYTLTYITPTGEDVSSPEVTNTTGEFVGNFRTVGGYAGVHTMMISDGLPGDASVVKYAPALLEGNRHYIPEGSGPVEFYLKGAHDGVSYQMKLLGSNKDNGVDYTLLGEEYGTVTTSNNGISNGGVLTITYTPPIDASKQHSFWLRGIADHEIYFPGDSYFENLLDAWVGPITILNYAPSVGMIVDDNGNPISGARVLLLEPGQYAARKETEADGKFEFTVSESCKYWCLVDKEGYIPKYFTSTDLFRNGGRIMLEPGSGMCISGAINFDSANLSSGDIIRVSLVDFNSGASVVLCETMVVITDETDSVDYRLDLATEDLPEGDKYAVVAYMPGFSVTALFSAPAYQAPIDDFNLTLARTLTLTDHYRDEYLFDSELASVSSLISPPLNIVNFVTELGGWSHSVFDEDNRLLVKIDVRPGSIDNTLLRPAASVQIYGEVFENPFQIQFASASQNMLKVMVLTEDDSLRGYNWSILSPRKIIVSIPFDLSLVGFNDFEKGRAVVWQADNQTALFCGQGQAIPVRDILSIDYIGDGKTGWVTFKTSDTVVFAVGSSSYLEEEISAAVDAERRRWDAKPDNIKGLEEAIVALRTLSGMSVTTTTTSTTSSTTSTTTSTTSISSSITSTTTSTTFLPTRYTVDHLDNALEQERQKWDVNGDNIKGLEEAIDALQIASELK